MHSKDILFFGSKILLFFCREEQVKRSMADMKIMLILVLDMMKLIPSLTTLML
jgi:hypothetical protein